MNARRGVIVLVVAVVLAVATVFVRTRIVTLGYELTETKREHQRLTEKAEQQKLQQETFTSPTQIEKQRTESPVDLAQPAQANRQPESE